jgi:hypothetical protein
MPINANASMTSFAVYRWSNPETTSDYPFLAVAEDKSALLSIGNYGISFDWGIPDEAVQWLEADFSPTGESLVVDCLTMKYVLDATFMGGAEFALVSFDAELAPKTLQLALAAQEEADQGPEYAIEGIGNYHRFYREEETLGPVAPSERSMLDVCMSVFCVLAAQCPQLVMEPPPPRYREPGVTV